MSFRVEPFRKRIESLSRLSLALQAIIGLVVLACLAVLVRHAYLEAEVAKKEFQIAVLQKERERILSQRELITFGPMSDGQKVISQKVARLVSVLRETKTLKEITAAGLAKSSSAAGVGGLEMPLKKKPNSDQHELSEEELLTVLDQIIPLLEQLPLAVPADAPVNSRFGPRNSPFSGDMKFHAGIDIAAPYGSPVWVPGDGIVEKVRYNKTYGLTVDVHHTHLLTTRFAHLSKSAVVVGQRVARGQLLGNVGSSGRATGPHLHYEIRMGNRAIDPVVLLRLAEKLKESL